MPQSSRQMEVWIWWWREREKETETEFNFIDWKSNRAGGKPRDSGWERVTMRSKAAKENSRWIRKNISFFFFSYLGCLRKRQKFAAFIWKISRDLRPRLLIWVWLTACYKFGQRGLVCPSVCLSVCRKVKRDFEIGNESKRKLAPSNL